MQCGLFETFQQLKSIEEKDFQRSQTVLHEHLISYLRWVALGHMRDLAQWPLVLQALQALQALQGIIPFRIHGTSYRICIF